MLSEVLVVENMAKHGLAILDLRDVEPAKFSIIERSLNSTAGVEKVEFNRVTGSARIKFDSDRVSIDKIRKKVKDLT